MMMIHEKDNDDVHETCEREKIMFLIRDKKRMVVFMIWEKENNDVYDT